MTEPAQLRALAKEIRSTYLSSQGSEMLERGCENRAESLESGVVYVPVTQGVLARRLMKEFGYDKPAALAGAYWLLQADDEAEAAFNLWWEKGVIDETVAAGTSVRELVDKYKYNPATAIALFNALLFDPDLYFPYAYADEDLFISAASRGYGASDINPDPV